MADALKPEMESPRRDRSTRADARDAFDALTETIWRLRQPDGCPWDREQTHASIAKNMIEEAYEAVDCIEDGDLAHLREELGDVLMQVMLHAQIAADEGAFNIRDVVSDLNEKLIRRHPHVFGDTSLEAGDASEVLDIWDQVKAAERASRGAGGDIGSGSGSGADGGAVAGEDRIAGMDEGAGSDVGTVMTASASAAAGEGAGAGAVVPAVARSEGLLESVPKSLPALMQAQKVSKRAAKVGFEWDTVDDVWAQVESEHREFEAEEPGSEARELEFGDMLFALVNVARREGIDAEGALRASTAKFRRRWAAVEDAATREGSSVDELSTAELNRLWDEVKAAERR